MLRITKAANSAMEVYGKFRRSISSRFPMVGRLIKKYPKTTGTFLFISSPVVPFWGPLIGFTLNKFSTPLLQGAAFLATKGAAALTALSMWIASNTAVADTALAVAGS